MFNSKKKICHHSGMGKMNEQMSARLFKNWNLKAIAKFSYKKEYRKGVSFIFLSLSLSLNFFSQWNQSMRPIEVLFSTNSPSFRNFQIRKIIPIAIGLWSLAGRLLIFSRCFTWHSKRPYVKGNQNERKKRPKPTKIGIYQLKVYLSGISLLCEGHEQWAIQQATSNEH